MSGAARTAASLGALFVAAVVAAEVLMRPSPGERLTLITLFAALTGVGAVAAAGVARLRGRLRSLRTTVALVGVTGVVAIAVVVIGATASMFLSAHDGRLALIALAFGSCLGLVLASIVGRPLTDDLQRVAEAATRLGRGDLDARTGVDRADELGTVAATLDDAAVQLAAAQRDRADRDRTRRALFAALGHDLRTPLTALRATAEALEDGVAPDPARYLATMRREIEDMSVLVDDLLTLARAEDGTLVLDDGVVDLGELADAVLDGFEPLAHARSVRLDAAGERSAKLRGDVTSLTRVMRNLVDNAVRHAPTGSAVTVVVDQGDGWVSCEVHDDGPGFPPDFRTHALTDLARTDATRSRGRSTGSGLGLAIASRLVEAHGGDLTIGRPPGGHVRVALPTDRQAALTIDRPPTA